MFYSNAMRAVESIKQERTTLEQWLKMIEKNSGMKAGEDKWLGLSEWLKGSDAKTLTKGEVLDYIRANEIQVEEVEYGEGNNKYETIADELRGSWNELYDEAYSKVKEKYEVEDESEIEWDWINDEIIGILEERNEHLRACLVYWHRCPSHVHQHCLSARWSLQTSATSFVSLLQGACSENGLPACFYGVSAEKEFDGKAGGARGVDAEEGGSADEGDGVEDKGTQLGVGEGRSGGAVVFGKVGETSSDHGLVGEGYEHGVLWEAGY